MHIPPYDNRNLPIVDAGDEEVPLAYFNIVRLRQGERFVSRVPGYETCLVPAHGTIDVQVYQTPNVNYGIVSWILTIFAAGVFLSGLRDLHASRRLRLYRTPS